MATRGAQRKALGHDQATAVAAAPQAQQVTAGKRGGEKYRVLERDLRGGQQLAERLESLAEELPAREPRDFEIQEASRFAYVTFKRFMYYTCDKPSKFLPEVTEALQAFENQSISQTASVEAKAAKLFSIGEAEMARDTLTNYSSQRAMDALDLGDALLGSIEARHRLLYGYRAPVGTEMSGYGHPPAVSVHCRDR